MGDDGGGGFPPLHEQGWRSIHLCSHQHQRRLVSGDGGRSMLFLNVRCPGLPFCRVLKLGAEGGCQKARAADGVSGHCWQASFQQPGAGGEIPHWCPPQLLPGGRSAGSGMGAGELQAAWPLHTSDGRCGSVFAYSWLLAGSAAPFLCHITPFEAKKHCSGLSAGGWAPGDRHTVQCGCLCASLTSVSGYWYLCSVDRWAETNRPQHKAPCKPVVWNPAVQH